MIFHCAILDYLSQWSLFDFISGWRQCRPPAEPCDVTSRWPIADTTTTNINDAQTAVKETKSLGLSWTFQGQVPNRSSYDMPLIPSVRWRLYRHDLY